MAAERITPNGLNYRTPFGLFRIADDERLISCGGAVTFEEGNIYIDKEVSA